MSRFFNSAVKPEGLIAGPDGNFWFSSGQNTNSIGKVRLYEGQREPQDFGFAGERVAWRAAAIETVEVLSRPHGDWSGRTGYVQAALLDDRPEVDRTVAYLCGMKGMVEAVRATLLTMGLPRERTHLNY